MTNERLITVLAGVLVALPGTAALVPNLTLAPEVSFVLLILSLVGAGILKQQNGSGLSDDDVRRIAEEREKIRRAEREKIRAAGEAASRG